jgi:hypothetical protein
MRCYNAAMSEGSGIVLFFTGLIVLPLAWCEWIRWRKSKSTPIEFSIAWVFGALSFVCMALGLAVFANWLGPIGFFLAAVILGSLIGAAIGFSFGRPWSGASLGGCIAALAVVAFCIWTTAHFFGWGRA